MIVSPDRNIVDPSGNANLRMLNWMDQMTRLQIVTGSGTPEAVIRAEIGTLYMDTAGTTGSILYIKRDGDIGGDTSKGWILV